MIIYDQPVTANATGGDAELGMGLQFFYFAAYPRRIVDLVLANAVGLCNWDVEVLVTLKSLIITNIFNSLTIKGFHC